MEPTEETLVEEIRHDRLVRSELIIGGVALVLLALVAAGAWYYLIRPAPAAPQETATTTPGTTQQASPAQDRHLDEVSTYYEIKAVYPSVTPLSASAGSEADAAAVAAMKQYEELAIAQFKKDGNFDRLSHDDVQMLGLDQRKESLDITYQVKSGRTTVSYVFIAYADTLGAHPNATYRTFTFDRATGAKITLADVFMPGTKYLTALSTVARAKLPAVIGTRIGTSAEDIDARMMNDGTTPDERNFLTWYLEGTDLVLIFPPYQVAAYAAGEIELRIPLPQLPIAAKYQ